MLKLEKFVKEEIVERIENFEERTVYLQDLAYYIFENENRNGIYYNRYDSIQWIKDYFEELDEIVEEYELEFGYSVPNPFGEPAKFQLVIIIYLADKIINNAIWNTNLEPDSEIELTKDIINTILEVL